MTAESPAVAPVLVGSRAVATEATQSSRTTVATAPSRSPRPAHPVAAAQTVVSAASATTSQLLSPGSPAQPISLATQDLAALIAAVPGSVEAVAAAPEAGIAGAQLSSSIAGQLAASTGDAISLWALTINTAITSALVERIRQAGTAGRVTTSFDPGLSLKGLRLSVNPALTLTYTVKVPINETITVPGQDIAVLGGTVGPIASSFGDGSVDVNVNEFTVPQTTMRVPDVTVQLGSPDTTVDVVITATVGGSALTLQPGNLFDASFTIDRIPVNVDGAVLLDVPFTATASGPITIQGFDVTGIGFVALGLPFNVGVCNNASNCNHTIHIPDIKLESSGPLLKGIIGGRGTSIPINARGGIGPIGVTLGGAFGPIGVGAIPFSLTGDIPLNVPITAKLGNLLLDGVTLPTGSWTPDGIASSFALWQTDRGWPLPAPWSDNAGTNMIIPVSAIATPPVAVQMPVITALIGGPDTTLPINVTGRVGATTAALQSSWGVPTGLTVAGAGGGEIPFAVKADIPIDIPVRVTATPIEISGIAAPSTPPPTLEADLPAAATVLVGNANVPPQSVLTSAQTAATPDGGVQARMEAFLNGLKLQAVTILNQAGSQLSVLPSSPMVNALSGALWRIRVALAAVGGDVGRWGTVDCVDSGDCSDKDLAGADLSGQNLGGVDFSRAVLARADLTRADLSGANLDAANLSGATLTSANLRNAILKSANLTGVTGLASATMTGANFAGARGLDLSGADLTSKDLTGTNLSGANLTGADLSGSTLIGAVLAGADLSAINPQRPTFLIGAKLSGANLVGANLSSANLSKASLTGANLAGANLSGATLTTTNLRDATLSFATLTSANGQFSILSGADMSGADLVGVNLGSANLRNTNLGGANLTNANLSFATLTGASLGGATLTGVRWKDTICPDGSKSSSGCGSPPIVVPAFQIGQGGLLGIPVGQGIGQGPCYVACVIPSQVGISITIGAQGPLPGPSTGVVIAPIIIRFPDNTALTATIGGPGKGIGIDVTAAAGPFTIPVQSVLPPVIGPIPTIAWQSSIDTRVDVPFDAAVLPLQLIGPTTSIPFDLSTWSRTGTCIAGSCTWSGWGGRVSLISGILRRAATPPPGDVPSAARATA